MTTRYFELAVRLFLIMPSANAMLCARKVRVRPLHHNIAKAGNHNNVQGAARVTANGWR